MTEKRLKLGELNFGLRDARNEFSSRDKELKGKFLRQFLLPPNIAVEDYLRGTRTLIVGPKGSGKTAFLRFLSEQISSDRRNIIRFVLFADEISSQEKNRLVELANSSTTIASTDGIELQEDYVPVWDLYLHRLIARDIELNRDKVAIGPEIGHYIEIAKEIYDGDIGNIKGFLLRLAASVGAKKIAPEPVASSIAKMESKSSKNVPLHFYINKLEDCLKNVCFADDGKYYIFIDEVNLSLISKMQRKRDGLLIRDLIISISKMNSFFVNNDINIFIIGAIRSEVQHLPDINMKEIDKRIHDLGTHLTWHTENSDFSNAPIFDLIRKKIAVSENEAGLNSSESDSIERYFPNNILGFNIFHFFAEMTWFTPRDFIILFDTIVKNTNSRFNDRFTEKDFIDVMSAYSRQCWEQRTEQLAAFYLPPEIETLKDIISRCGKVINRTIFENSAAESYDSNIHQFTRTHDFSSVVKNLYYCGIVGELRDRNERYVRFASHADWYHRGRTAVSSSGRYVIHAALWQELKIGRISRLEELGTVPQSIVPVARPRRR